MRTSLAALFFLITFFLCPLAADNVLSPDQVNDGWIALFDGESLFGWQSTGEANWRVEDGVIRVDSGRQGWLMTTSEFADYELQVEFQAPPSTNSGIFFRTPLEPQKPGKDSYEVDIAPPTNSYPTGSLVGHVKVQPASAGNTNVWHQLHLTAQGPQITVTLDGTQVVTYTDPQPLHGGHIGLQFREGPIAFRNVLLKPLGMKPLFNGQDLTGWNTKRADKSEITVTPAKTLQVKGGPGQLESDTQYGDFILQLQCKVNGEKSNSGIFFRSIPGDFLMGYESQINNAMVDGDPTKPADCGTGGIFRRQNARRIVARDHQWFAKTIVASGPHMAVWVNGYQVSDWTDDRKPNENPRRGLRLAPGTIAIQGHDPTTDLEFRGLRIAEMPEE